MGRVRRLPGLAAIVSSLLFIAACEPLGLRGTIEDIVERDTVPASPTGLVASAASSTAIDLSWTDNSSNETGFVLERSLQEAEGFAMAAQPGANTTSFQDTGLQPGTDYHYRLCAVGDAGRSGYTPVATARTNDAAAPPQPPAAPANLRVTAQSSTTLSLAWDAASGADTYRVYRSDTQAGTYTQQVQDLTQTSWTDTGLTPQATYWYRVSAHNTAGASAQSAPVSGTTTLIGLYHLDGASWVQDPAPPAGMVAITGFSGQLWGWMGETPETPWVLDQTWSQASGAELAGVVSIAGWENSLFALLDTGALMHLDGATWLSYHVAAPSGSTAIAAVGATLYALTPTDIRALDGQSWSSVGSPANAVSIAGSGATLVAQSSDGTMYYLDGTWKRSIPDAPPGAAAIGGVGTTVYALVR